MLNDKHRIPVQLSWMMWICTFDVKLLIICYTKRRLTNEKILVENQKMLSVAKFIWWHSIDTGIFESKSSEFSWITKVSLIFSTNVICFLLIYEDFQLNCYWETTSSYRLLSLSARFSLWKQCFLSDDSLDSWSFPLF